MISWVEKIPKAIAQEARRAGAHRLRNRRHSPFPPRGWSSAEEIEANFNVNRGRPFRRKRTPQAPLGDLKWVFKGVAHGKAIGVDGGGR
ncbi:Hypothetical protein FKW44_004889 [Caligus rogercresseyi]|uniref:Uncharacterized protein n=1 Tax=Caligus rogercresseyi TaxID=217165 RepID=A0A7T8HNC0_CALRO|nr:Hypothetical protein FKW44_004889 [Caligus rogercresseyi]